MTVSLTQWLRQCIASLRPRQRLVRPVLTRAICSAQTATRSRAPVCTSAGSARACTAPRISAAHTPSTRIIEWETAANGNARTLGRVVMVGKFSEICAELDRLAALEMA